ncbi:MAG TPA: 4a-hydroxytetrahydrobiopterin dehydratase [Abditibacteriaceae bacterium]|jgi:4a-hydroxytetrahydrobiopterin dehydratase
MAKLTPTQISDGLQTLNGWVQEGDAIRKQYVFDDFAAAMTFVNRVAELAEEADHHPDIDIRYNKVTLVLSTHSAGGLTKKDIALAQHIEAL